MCDNHLCRALPVLLTILCNNFYVHGECSTLWRAHIPLLPLCHKITALLYHSEVFFYLHSIFIQFLYKGYYPVVAIAVCHTFFVWLIVNKTVQSFLYNSSHISVFFSIILITLLKFAMHLFQELILVENYIQLYVVGK